MNVSLTRELEQFVHDRVDTGRYHSASEVVRDGLRLLESREQLRELQMDEIRRRMGSNPDPVAVIPPESSAASLPMYSGVGRSPDEGPGSQRELGSRRKLGSRSAGAAG